MKKMVAEASTSLSNGFKGPPVLQDSCEMSAVVSYFDWVQVGAHDDLVEGSS